MPENLKPSRKGTRPDGEVDVDVEDTDNQGQGIQARALHLLLLLTRIVRCTYPCSQDVYLTRHFHFTACSPSALFCPKIGKTPYSQILANYNPNYYILTQLYCLILKLEYLTRDYNHYYNHPTIVGVDGLGHSHRITPEITICGNNGAGCDRQTVIAENCVG